jgi:hypothetical protein
MLARSMSKNWTEKASSLTTSNAPRLFEKMPRLSRVLSKFFYCNSSENILVRL